MSQWLKKQQQKKNLPAMQEMRVQSLDQEDPLEEEMAIHSNVLAGESHEQRSMVDPSPWGHKETDITSMWNLKYTTD